MTDKKPVKSIDQLLHDLNRELINNLKIVFSGEDFEKLPKEYDSIIKPIGFKNLLKLACIYGAIDKTRRHDFRQITVWAKSLIALGYIEEGLKVADANGHNPTIVAARSFAAHHFEKEKDLTNALKMANIWFAKAQELPCELKLIEAGEFVAELLYAQNDFKGALKKVDEILPIAKKQADYWSSYKLNLHKEIFGRIYFDIKQLKDKILLAQSSATET